MTVSMPAHTQRAHFEPSWKGDRLEALAEVARHPLGRDGIRAIDCNFQWAWRDPADHTKGGGAFALHWGNPAQDNYHFIVLEGGRHTRPMTRAELSLNVAHWPLEAVHRWRRDASHTSARPPTYAAMVREAVRLDVVICAELKSKAFRLLGPAAHLVHTARHYGHPPYFMALYRSMPYCREKCAHVVRAGGAFAVIFGRFPEHRAAFAQAVPSWPVQPTRVW